MESEPRGPRPKEPPPPQWHPSGGSETLDTAYYRPRTEGITESLQSQLQAMHSAFCTASDSILAQISDTGTQLEHLQRRIDEMVEEAGYRLSSASTRSQTQMPSHGTNDSSQTGLRTEENAVRRPSRR